VAPAIERLGQWRTWITWAAQLTAVALQTKVSEALNALPRGEPSPPGTRFRRSIFAFLPDIEAMELVERFFEVGGLVAGTDHAVGIFLAGCREALSEWEGQATELFRCVIHPTRWTAPPADPTPDADASTGDVCPRGQNARDGRISA